MNLPVKPRHVGATADLGQNLRECLRLACRREFARSLRPGGGPVRLGQELLVDGAAFGLGQRLLENVAVGEVLEPETGVAKRLSPVGGQLAERRAREVEAGPPARPPAITCSMAPRAAALAKVVALGEAVGAVAHG